MRKILLLVAMVASMSWAGFFIDENQTKTEDARELPSFLYGGGLDVGFYLNSFDFGVNLSAEYRLAKHHSLGLAARGLFGGGVYEAELDYRFFFTGGMMQNGDDDFLRATVSAAIFEKFDKVYVSPVVSVGYGRDFLPLPKASFLLRLELGMGYVIGEGLPQKDDDALVTRETHILAHINIGVYLF